MGDEPEIIRQVFGHGKRAAYYLFQLLALFPNEMLK